VLKRCVDFRHWLIAIFVSDERRGRGTYRERKNAMRPHERAGTLHTWITLWTDVGLVATYLCLLADMNMDAKQGLT